MSFAACSNHHPPTCTQGPEDGSPEQLSCIRHLERLPGTWNPTFSCPITPTRDFPFHPGPTSCLKGPAQSSGRVFRDLGAFRGSPTPPSSQVKFLECFHGERLAFSLGWVRGCIGLGVSYLLQAQKAWRWHFQDWAGGMWVFEPSRSSGRE